ncbi:MAG: hypothetical protein WDO13_08835 [Verrucomicrobiota bacterium]
MLPIQENNFAKKGSYMFQTKGRIAALIVEKADIAKSCVIGIRLG